MKELPLRNHDLNQDYATFLSPTELDLLHQGQRFFLLLFYLNPKNVIYFHIFLSQHHLIQNQVEMFLEQPIQLKPSYFFLADTKNHNYNRYPYLLMALSKDQLFQNLDSNVGILLEIHLLHPQASKL